MNARVVFVDDDKDVREALGQSLELGGYQTVLCKSFIEAIDHISRSLDGVIVTDIRMPGKDGFDLLERTHSIDPDIPVIVLTGEGDIPMAVRAVQGGAYDFLEKPCAPQRLIDAVVRAIEKRRLVLENRRLHAERNALSVVRETAAKEGLAIQMDMVEKLLIEDVLSSHQGRVAIVAEILKLPRKTLYDKLKRHGIDPAIYRS